MSPLAPHIPSVLVDRQQLCQSALARYLEKLDDDDIHLQTGPLGENNEYRLANHKDLYSILNSPEPDESDHALKDSTDLLLDANLYRDCIGNQYTAG